jgi:hypothetical protein
MADSVDTLRDTVGTLTDLGPAMQPILLLKNEIASLTNHRAQLQLELTQVDAALAKKQLRLDGLLADLKARLSLVATDAISTVQR